MNKFLYFFASIFLVHGAAQAKDWPTWRADPERSGYTPEELPETLHLRWSLHSLHPPRPAWPRSNRMTFDRAFPFIVAGGTLYFGSSIDCSIHALDAATGETRWTFPTQAPVRFAPTFWKGRVFATSDDGYLYCLAAEDGSLLWKKRGGPGDEWILGNGRMISRWPARGGVVIRDDILYFAAGIWPSDGVSLYALDPETGKTLWLNDTAGSIYMGQPHGGAFAKSGVAAQGYLAASDNSRFSWPRAGPFPRPSIAKSGEFQYLSLQANTRRGGAEVMLSDDFFINGGHIPFKKRTGALNGKIGDRPTRCNARWIGRVHCKNPGTRLATGPGQEVLRSERQSDSRHEASRNNSGFPSIKPPPLRNRRRRTDHPGKQGPGPDHRSRGSSPSIGKPAFRAIPYAMAVSDQQLFVSTDQGVLYCFGRNQAGLASQKWKSDRRNRFSHRGGPGNHRQGKGDDRIRPPTRSRRRIHCPRSRQADRIYSST